MITNRLDGWVQDAKEVSNECGLVEQAGITLGRQGRIKSMLTQVEYDTFPGNDSLASLSSPFSSSPRRPHPFNPCLPSAFAHSPFYPFPPSTPRPVPLTAMSIFPTLPPDAAPQAGFIPIKRTLSTRAHSLRTSTRKLKNAIDQASLQAPEEKRLFS